MQSEASGSSGPTSPPLNADAKPFEAPMPTTSPQKPAPLQTPSPKADRFIPEWVAEIERNLARHRRGPPEAKYVSLATVTPDGLPSVRTMVFRGWTHQDMPGAALLGTKSGAPAPCGPVLRFISDRRTRKLQEIHAQPFVELSWWFPKTREQWRIAGRILVIDEALAAANSEADVARRSQWGNLSNSARAQMLWPEPGQPRDAAVGEGPWEGTEDPGPRDVAPDFCLLFLVPERVDWLVLKPPQRRVSFVLEPVAPAKPTVAVEPATPTTPPSPTEPTAPTTAVESPTEASEDPPPAAGTNGVETEEPVGAADAEDAAGKEGSVAAEDEDSAEVVEVQDSDRTVAKCRLEWRRTELNP